MCLFNEPLIFYKTATFLSLISHNKINFAVRFTANLKFESQDHISTQKLSANKKLMYVRFLFDLQIN